jgi:hypothetical protein
MSSYEVVRRSIEFDNPPRLPIQFWELELSDINTVFGNFRLPDYTPDQDPLDEWGCEWEVTTAPNMGQVIGHPLADWENLDHFRWPDPDNSAYYEGMEKQFEHCGGKYVRTMLFMLCWDRLQALRGFENAAMDLRLEHERIEMLADRIIEFNIGVMQNYARRFPGMIHGIWCLEDWGTQQNLMISPKLWKEFFKPRYKKVVDAVHEIGWHMWLHTCGKVNAILEELIDLGVEVVNLQQPTVLGIEEVGKQFRGRICFETSCDIQKTISSKNKSLDQIRDEVNLLLNTWAAPNGGFIVSDYAEGAAIGVGMKRKIAMLSYFLEADPWRVNVTGIE